MKLSPVLFRVPRRLASEVIESATSKIEAGASAPKAYFDELPEVLKRFFQRYPPSPFREYANSPRMINDPGANPFLANKNPVTHRWQEPKYSMRRQADLWKAAYRFGIQHLMPPLLHNRKFYEGKYADGIKMKGAKFFKLSHSERIAPARAAEVANAYKQLDSKISERKGIKKTSK